MKENRETTNALETPTTHLTIVDGSSDLRLVGSDWQLDDPTKKVVASSTEFDWGIAKQRYLDLFAESLSEFDLV